MSVWVTWPALTKLGTLGVVSGLLVLAVERQALFENNLFDVENYAGYNANISCDARSQAARTEDGTCNILSNPAEGSVYRRFGRNVNPALTQGETSTLLTPNPREVSNKLMARGEFKPAASLNFIAAAWIQFMVHDWFDHGPNADADPIQFPLPAGDVLGSGSMSVKRTQPDPSRSSSDAGKPQTYRNHNTHWWDGSQLYGSSKETNDKVRAFVDGKLKVNADGTLPHELLSGKSVTGFNENWWVGLSMLHQLFTLEHNAIASKLKQKYPAQSDQWLYDRARLINAALMAKIHTVEWTPAVIANPITERAMYSNWWGLLGQGGPRDDFQAEVRMLQADLAKSDSFVKRILGFDPNVAPGVGNSAIDHALTGIVGSTAPNNYGVPFTLTEEFVSVYRMHPLMRDNVQVYDIGSNQVSRTIALQNTRDRDAESLLNDERPERLWYSFGITNPGSLTLHNYPNFLRNLSMPLVGDIDLAAIDVLRDRERGVPRYNEFRRQIGLKPISKFEDLTKDAATLAELKRLYSNDIEKIDTLVGQLAETVRPEGFAFGETAFQIFIMNASRRLMADRFYTKDYRPEVYTPEGIDWVEHTTLVGLALVTTMSVSLAWQSADWLRLLRPPVAASNDSTDEAPVMAVNPEIGQLFGTSSAANDGPAPSTNLRLTLLGSFVHADPTRSSAIIRSEGSSAQRYNIDSEISSGVRLHSVAADRVELLRNGRRESLSFPLNSSTAGNLQSNTQEVMADPLEQLSEMESDDLSQLRERMDALRQQMQDSGTVPSDAEPTDQPTENN